MEQQLQAALFLYHHFGGACSKRARSESQSAASLCDLETQEMNIWPETAFWQDTGPQFLGLVLVVCVTAAVLIRGFSLVEEGSRLESAQGEMCWPPP